MAAMRFPPTGERIAVYQYGDSPFGPPGNGWNLRGPMPEFVPSPARLYDPVTELLVAAEGQPVDPERIPHLLTEERLHARQRGEVPLEEPSPTSHKGTRAKTRARKPGENRARA